MKININNKLYIQKKDIELITRAITQKNMPKSIVDILNNSVELDELDFIQFENIDDINFLNSFNFVINYIDFRDFTDFEIVEFRQDDLDMLRKMRFAFDASRTIDDNKAYNNVLSLIRERYLAPMPSVSQAKNIH